MPLCFSLLRTLLPLALLVASVVPATAAITYTVGLPAITNYVAPGYVIDSDAARGNTNYFRHLLPCGCR
jgi:predicted exporter